MLRVLGNMLCDLDLKSQAIFFLEMHLLLKDKDYCPIEIIKGLTDKGQFQ